MPEFLLNRSLLMVTCISLNTSPAKTLKLIGFNANRTCPFDDTENISHWAPARQDPMTSRSLPELTGKTNLIFGMAIASVAVG
jgi:hypothetical protein